MIIRIIVIILSLNIHGIGQPIRVYNDSYDGPAGSIIKDSIQAVPNTTYLIEYCTHFVPDKLIIYLDNGDSLKFYIGSQLTTNLIIGNYHGYCEFIYENDTLTVVITDSKPVDKLQCGLGANIGGAMRLYYTTSQQQCTLKFKIIGNKFAYTVYDLSIDQLTIPNDVDTIYYPICHESSFDNSFYRVQDCKQLFMTPEYHGINDDPIISNLCYGKTAYGSVTFPEHPEWDIDSLPIGSHNIEVTNGYCTKVYNIVILEDICNLYIPNVFNPKSDNNTTFVIHSDVDVPYTIDIFDRWGNLLYQSDRHITNGYGWNGFTNDFQICLPGVYVYKIKIINNIYTGNVTILH